MQKWSLDDLPKFFNLFLASADIAVRNIRFLLNLHHSDGGVDLGWQWNMDLIFVTINSDPHALLNIRRRNRVCKIDDKLCKLLDVDDILGIVRVSLDDLCASCNLQRLFILKRLLVSRKIPKSRRSQTSVGLFNSS